MHEVPNHAELEAAFENSFEKDPTSSSWGFFAYDDTPGVLGGGAGNFSWFDSKEELFSFLIKFPLLLHSSGTTDSERFDKAKDYLAHATTESFDQETLDGLNRINSGVEQIQWYGQLNDLLTSDGEFPKGMRTFFAGSSDPLNKTKIPEFAEFLRGWGH